ncbi:hypothetical protein CCR95_17145 [Thiocystis minor]|uniref:hypothetical protein n=1 Tax=Thiocystis minor TaxID=61597 RepID=UPI001911ACA7|nr:hypothetical protein [Thiocystis minor]MBK5965757.1 hypothetical protein [Thiocystis minor]
MTDAELVAEFMRLTEMDGKTVLEVGVVEWSGPHEPELVWKRFHRWTTWPTAERLAVAQRKALETVRFFRICSICNERQNAGHMMDRETCQSCAEKHLGVVF